MALLGPVAATAARLGRRARTTRTNGTVQDDIGQRRAEYGHAPRRQVAGLLPRDAELPELVERHAGGGA
ncbi:MAG: hypothetical protein D6763_04960 [Alphaproteobacteria bacterium]|nr:MAG: hypothetical protein D6763_04960 [Alphaproteobacteria bacterium]